MAYSDHSPKTVGEELKIDTAVGVVFGPIVPLPVPQWLNPVLERGRREPILTEKARSEFLVAPLLLAAKESCGRSVSIYSGHRIDVDAARGLVGECDFVIAKGTSVPALNVPLLIVVEAKRHDLEGGVWQCLAQMYAARIYDEKKLGPRPVMYGCVTNGEAWQFLRLAGQSATIDETRYYVNEVGPLLAAFQQAIVSADPDPEAPS